MHNFPLILKQHNLSNLTVYWWFIEWLWKRKLNSIYFDYYNLDFLKIFFCLHIMEASRKLYDSYMNWSMRGVRIFPESISISGKIPDCNINYFSFSKKTRSCYAASKEKKKIIIIILITFLFKKNGSSYTTNIYKIYRFFPVYVHFSLLAA